MILSLGLQVSLLCQDFGIRLPLQSENGRGPAAKQLADSKLRFGFQPEHRRSCAAKQFTELDLRLSF